MSTSKVKGSSGLFNILLIALGAVFIFKGILEFLPVIGILVPPGWDPVIGIGGQWLLSIVLGIWCLISGIGLFKEAEWAMGQALVLLSLMVVITINAILSWIINPGIFDFAYWPNYIIILAFCMGVFGIIYLIITRKRFD
ncbi:MAG: hypothetical protein JSV23_10100 [Promethearchaeota archaeon]|nr:MAG: hypothetical protein JSV23_10100 [Candidatus Lokiarchaeota archaeon]